MGGGPAWPTTRHMRSIGGGPVIELRPDGRWYRDGEPVSDEQAEAYRQAFGRSIVDLLGRDEPG